MERRQKVAQTRTRAERGKEVKPRAPAQRLRADMQSGSGVDRSAQVKERAAELGAAAEGDAHAGASAAARMRLPSDAGPFRLLKKNRLVKISYPRPPP